MDASVLAENTEAFIAEAPTTIALRRRTKVDDGAGGWEWGSESLLDEQDVRLAPTNSRVQPQRTTENGTIVTPEKIAICSVNADIEKSDKFTVDGRSYEVVFVNRMRWSIHAEVVGVGSR